MMLSRFFDCCKPRYATRMPDLLRLRTLPETEDQVQYGFMSRDQTSDRNDATGAKIKRSFESNEQQSKTFAPLGRYQGIFYALLCSIIIVLYCSLIKNLNQYNPIGIVFYYSIFSTSFTLPSLVWNIRSFPEVTKRLLKLWTALVLFIGISGICRVYAFQLLPIGEASSITFSTPIFTAVFARIILKDRLTWMTVISLLVSVVGVLLIIRFPELITSGDKRLDSIEHFIGCCHALGNVLSSSGIFILLRCLRDTSSVLNAFIQQIGTCILYACFAPAFGGSLIPPCNVNVIAKLISIGILVVLYSVLMNLAMQKDDPTTVGTVYRSADIMLSFLVQVIIFKEYVDAYSIFGGLLVFSCGLLMPFQKWMEGQKEGSVWRKSRFIKRI